MKTPTVAALALTAASSLHAQAAPAIPDLATATVMTGNWSWRQMADGSQAVFTNASNSSVPQITIQCIRATRRIKIAKPATAPAAYLGVWTSDQSKNLPASFDSATGRLSADLAASDAVLDLMAMSRGRLGFSVAGAAPLVVPSWPEVARVIEDCRA